LATSAQSSGSHGTRSFYSGESCRRQGRFPPEIGHGDWLTVGDVAYFDDEGFFYICDRKNDMIISGGMNIYPAEIEAALDRHPDVMDVAVIGIPSEEWGEAVHAVVKRAHDRLDADALIEWARGHLAGYKLPRSISWTDEIPRNASRKILKKVLREPFWAGRERRVG
jgi:acyl-CoA synthetase (AMP-forming)/AMP-acid ligase II